MHLSFKPANFEDFTWQEGGKIFKVVAYHEGIYTISQYHELGTFEKTIEIPIETMYHKVLIRAMLMINTALTLFTDHEHFDFFVQECLRLSLDKQRVE